MSGWSFITQRDSFLFVHTVWRSPVATLTKPVAEENDEWEGFYEDGGGWEEF